MLHRLALLFAALALLSCQNRGPDFLPMNEEEIQVYKEKGAMISGSLISAMQIELKRELMAGGPVGAVDYCNLRALELTDSLARAHGVQLRRVSEKLRNPLNAPDLADARALRVFRSHVDMSTPPAEVMQKFHRGQREIVRYYKPLFVAAPCMNCHGDAAGFSGDLSAALQERYPADQATGYSPGDWRGLLRVEFTVPETN